jgi:hypothetical protein
VSERVSVITVVQYVVTFAFGAFTALLVAAWIETSRSLDGFRDQIETMRPARFDTEWISEWSRTLVSGRFRDIDARLDALEAKMEQEDR